MKFRSTPREIKGSLCPLMTPFTDEGAVDLVGLKRMAEYQLANGTHGLSLGGSTGEPSAQSAAERIAAMKVVAEVTADSVPFLPGTGSAKMDETLEITAAADELGADAALVITPYYARPTQEALFTWYSIVAKEFPHLPIVIYNVPSRTAVEIAPETAARLAKAHDNIVGIKETTKDFEHFSRVFELCGRDFLMWSGIELLCLPLLPLGGIGFISALANIAPQAVSDMYTLGIANEWQAARDIHYGVHPLVDLLFVETNPAPGKYVLKHKLGLIESDHVRLPLIGVTQAGRTKVDALWEQGKAFASIPQETSA